MRTFERHNGVIHDSVKVTSDDGELSYKVAVIGGDSDDPIVSVFVNHQGINLGIRLPGDKAVELGELLIVAGSDKGGNGNEERVMDETTKRYEVRTVGGVPGKRAPAELLVAYDSFEAAAAVAKREANRFPRGTCVLDTETGLVDYGVGSKEAAPNT
jgi:hypothetical protein